MPAVGGGQEGRVVVVRRLGDELLEGDIPADRVSGVIEQGVHQCPHNTTVPVCKRVDGQQVQHEQADQQHRMVPSLYRSISSTVKYSVLAAETGTNRTSADPSGDRSTTRLSLSLNRPPSTFVCSNRFRCRCSNRPMFSGRQSWPNR